MKIVLTTTTLVALLAIGLLGISNIGSNINNAFAQGDGMMGNDTGMMNATFHHLVQMHCLYCCQYCLSLKDLLLEDQLKLLLDYFH